jgi:hypothetical protein
MIGMQQDSLEKMHDILMEQAERLHKVEQKDSV